jgi:hypothetical protein
VERRAARCFAQCRRNEGAARRERGGEQRLDRAHALGDEKVLPLARFAPPQVSG